MDNLSRIYSFQFFSKKSSSNEGSFIRLALLRMGFFLLLSIYFPAMGFTQTRIIETYAGPSLPVNGTQATTQTIDGPCGVALDGEGGFYIASVIQNMVYRVRADGTLNLIAGSNTSGYGGDGGPATAALLSGPCGVAVDSAGNLYIADSDNNRVRKVTPAGTISSS
jgi:hypothetical protein